MSKALLVPVVNRPLPEQVPKKQKVAAPLEDFMDIDDSAKPDTDVSRQRP